MHIASDINRWATAQGCLPARSASEYTDSDGAGKSVYPPVASASVTILGLSYKPLDALSFGSAPSYNGFENAVVPRPPLSSVLWHTVCVSVVRAWDYGLF